MFHGSIRPVDGRSKRCPACNLYFASLDAHLRGSSVCVRRLEIRESRLARQDGAGILGMDLDPAEGLSPAPQGAAINNLEEEDLGRAGQGFCNGTVEGMVNEISGNAVELGGPADAAIDAAALIAARDAAKEEDIMDGIEASELDAAINSRALSGSGGAGVSKVLSLLSRKRGREELTPEFELTADEKAALKSIIEVTKKTGNDILGSFSGHGTCRWRNLVELEEWLSRPEVRALGQPWRNFELLEIEGTTYYGSTVANIEDVLQDLVWKGAASSAPKEVMDIDGNQLFGRPELSDRVREIFVSALAILFLTRKYSLSSQAC